MRILNILSHPVLLISIFLLVLISGEAFGGVYLLYLVLALPYGAIHALLAVAGIAILLISFAKYGRVNKYLIGPLLNLTGLALLISSLYSFFANDTKNYNASTFEQTVPLLSFALFALFSLIFILDNILRVTGKKMVLS